MIAAARFENITNWFLREVGEVIPYLLAIAKPLFSKLFMTTYLVLTWFNDLK